MQYIELGGEAYPVQFGISTLQKLGEKYKKKQVKDIGLLLGEIQYQDIPWLLADGIHTAASVMGQKIDISKKEIEALASADFTLFTPLITAMGAQLTERSGAAEEEEEAEEEEKKQTEPVFKK
jgi:hypothetical protein